MILTINLQWREMSFKVTVVGSQQVDPLLATAILNVID